ncbi:hypothetical protein [Candidatus Poriferisodalis sp.]|uniref:hypothetical protein n=1 Tax=Candidatus Poriferisodalis sp. TaxID=3101277 RepID=UPI003B02C8B8
MCLLVLGVLPIVPAAAQRQDIYDVEPTLFDKQGDYTWFVPPEEVNDLGYEGSFSFTLAIGDSSDDELDNWAYWSFNSADGRYEVQAYIPSQWATAHPQYLIWADSDGDGSFSNNYVAGPYLNQASGSGWRTIGEYDLSGDVRIEVRDVRARDDYRTVGAANARLAVDAMRLKRVTQTFPPGAVELTSVDYEVTNRSNGSGRVVWGRVQEATSYDLDVTVGVENVNDGRTDELEFDLTNVSCCSRSFSASSGWRITAVQMSVRAVNASGAGVWSAPIIEGISYPVARPGVISGLRYDRAGSRIVWQPERVATAYDIEWKQPDSGTSRTVALCSNSDNTLSGSRCALQITRVRHEALEFRVRAKNKNGTQFGPWSSWNTDDAETARPVEVPGAVTGVRWQSGRIVWQSAPRATAYDVDWRYRGETTTRQSVNCESNCSLGVSRDPTRTLEFRVRGKNGGGNGPWSSWADESAEVTLPSAVDNVEYRSGRIAWSPASNAIAYDIEWRHEGQSLERDSVTCPPSCQLVVERVAGKRLEFRVRGKNTAGRGPWSDWAHAAAQIVRPGHVQGLAYSNGRIRWIPLAGITAYGVEWTSGGRTSSRSVTCNASCSLAVSASSSGQMELRVRATNSAGVGPWSPWISASAVTGPPGRVSGVKYREGAIVWDPAPRADSYEIQWFREIGATSQGSTQTNITCASTCRFKIEREDELRFRVRAKNPAGFGPWSQYVTEGREATPPRRLETPRVIDVVEIRGSGAATFFYKHFLDNYDGNDVRVTWSNVPHTRHYKVEYRYRDLSNANTSSFELFAKSIVDGNTTCQPISSCAGSETVSSSLTQHTFVSFADTPREHANLLEFRVTAFGDQESRSHPSSWHALRLHEQQRELASQERTGSTLCHKVDSVGQFLGYLAIFRAATEDLGKAALVGANNQLELIPSLDGVAVEAVKMLNGCYKNPVEALESIPLVGPIVEVTAGPFLDRLHSAYAELADVTVGSGDASAEIGRICRIFRFFGGDQCS